MAKSGWAELLLTVGMENKKSKGSKHFILYLALQWLHPLGASAQTIGQEGKPGRSQILRSHTHWAASYENLVCFLELKCRSSFALMLKCFIWKRSRDDFWVQGGRTSKQADGSVEHLNPPFLMTNANPIFLTTRVRKILATGNISAGSLFHSGSAVKSLAVSIICTYL